MARYIDADKRLAELKEKEESREIGFREFECMKYALKCAQTADVVEVKHGKWIVKDESYWRTHYSGDIQVNKAGLYCSRCNKRLAKAQKYKNFCPNCGADMRERREDEI